MIILCRSHEIHVQISMQNKIQVQWVSFARIMDLSLIEPKHENILSATNAN